MNKLENALKELQAINSVTESQIKEIKSIETKEKDLDFNKVALVQLLNNPAEKKYDAKISVQLFSNNGLERVIKNKHTLGYDHVVLLHSADLHKEDLRIKKQEEAEAKLRAEKERAEKEANLQIKVKTIDEMTVPELKEYASKNNIDLGDVVIKADIIEVIKKTNLQ